MESIIRAKEEERANSKRDKISYKQGARLQNKYKNGGDKSGHAGSVSEDVAGSRTEDVVEMRGGRKIVQRVSFRWWRISQVKKKA